MTHETEARHDGVWAWATIVLVSVISVGTAAWCLLIGGGISTLDEAVHGIGYKGIFATASIIFIYGGFLVFSRRPQWRSIFLTILASTLFAFNPFTRSDLPGFPAAISPYLQQLHTTLIFIAAVALTLPYVFKNVRRLHRSPAHLAAMGAIWIFLALQLAFHLTIVIPGAQLVRHEREALFVKLEKYGPHGLETLMKSEPLSAVRIAPSGASGREKLAPFVQARMPDPEAALASVEAIRRDAPGKYDVWKIEGPNAIDGGILVHLPSEPTEGAQRDYFIPPEAFAADRLFAVRAYYGLTALSVWGWFAAAMIVAWYHDPARKLRKRKALN